MKKKKVDKILKGVLTVGTVIGGANVMSDADMVYAAELETDSTAPVTEFDVPASTTEAAQEVTYLQSDAPAEVPSAADTAPTPVEPVAPAEPVAPVEPTTPAEPSVPLEEDQGKLSEAASVSDVASTTTDRKSVV